MSEPHVARRWRLSCLGMLGVGVALLAILVGIIGVWTCTTGDLRAVDARAKAIGVPVTWDEVGLTLSPPDVRDDWRKLHQLAESVKNYQTICESEWLGPKIGQPIPDELRAHHASLPLADMAAILSLCDRLRPDSVTMQTEMDIFSLLPHLNEGRQLSQLLNERLALVLAADVQPEARRHLAAIMAEEPRCLLQGLVATSRVAIWQQGLVRRLADPGIDRASLAAMVDLARQWVDRQQIASMRAEFTTLRRTFQAIADGEPRYADVGTMFGLPRWAAQFGLHKPLLRYGRRTTLDDALDGIQSWTGATDAPAQIKVLRDQEASLSARAGQWQYALCNLLRSGTTMVGWSWVKADTQLAVLAAELRGQPWPADPTDPAGGQVRPVVRAGRTIGFYLLGKDGVDDGGTMSSDFCFPLTEALGKPKAGDPLVAVP